jgi:hypothetical protein
MAARKVVSKVKSAASAAGARVKKAAGKAAGEAAGGGNAAVKLPGLWEMLKGGAGFGEILKAHPWQIGLGSLFLLQLIFSRILQHYKSYSQVSGQEGLLNAQLQASPEDVYYQAMLPQLTQERQAAQTALLQAILSGTGQVPLVPGERMIGGGGGGYGGMGGYGGGEVSGA